MKFINAPVAALELFAFGWLAYWGMALRPMLLAAPVLNPDIQFFILCERAVAAGTGALVILSICVALQTLSLASQAKPSAKLSSATLAILPMIGLAIFYAWLYRGQ